MKPTSTSKLLEQLSLESVQHWCAISAQLYKWTHKQNVEFCKEHDLSVDTSWGPDAESYAIEAYVNDVLESALWEWAKYKGISYEEANQYAIENF